MRYQFNSPHPSCQLCFWTIDKLCRDAARNVSTSWKARNSLLLTAPLTLSIFLSRNDVDVNIV